MHSFSTQSEPNIDQFNNSSRFQLSRSKTSESRMIRQVILLLFIASTALAIAPQVRAPPRPQSFQTLVPAQRLSHPLPASQGPASPYYTGSYSGSSTNRVNSYTRPNPVRAYPAVSPVRTFPAVSPIRVSPSNDIQIVRSEFVDNQDGGYSYVYENSDGTKSEQRGYLKPARAAGEDPILVVEGSYSYYGEDGQLYTVNYIADENGYRPTGTHLPSTPAPVIVGAGGGGVPAGSVLNPSFRRPFAPVRRF